MPVGFLYRKGFAFQNVVASGVALVEVVVGRTIESLVLKLGGGAFTKAMISLVRIKANGRTVFEGSGTQIDKLNAFKGYTTNAAYLDILFEDLTGLREFDRQVGALDTTQGIVKLTVEVTIAGATTPTLDLYINETAAQVDGQGRPAPFAGVLSKTLRFPFTFAAGGKQNIALPWFGQSGAILKRLHIEHGGNMTALELKEDSNVIHESLKADNDYENTKWGRVNQTNMYSVDFVSDGNVEKAWNTRGIRSLEVNPTFSAADSGYIIAEVLDVLGNL